MSIVFHPPEEFENPLARDLFFMHCALKLAQSVYKDAHPNPNVGCVIVQGKTIVGQGAHHVFGGPHAEIIALQEAGEKALQSEVYVTLEPCSHHGKTPPCVDALIAQRVKRVIIATHDPHPLVEVQGGIKKLKKAGIVVVTGILQHQARAVHFGFDFFYRSGRPLVALKIAQTLDSKVATLQGPQEWISSPQALQDAHKLRARYHAILIGIQTALLDNPTLNVRLVPSKHHPVRLLLDSHLQLPLSSNLVKNAQAPLWIFSQQPSLPSDLFLYEKRKEALSFFSHIRFFEKPLPPHKSDINSFSSHWTPSEILAVLKENYLYSVLIEGGPRIWQSFLKEKTYDLLYLYQSPFILGNGKEAFLNPSPTPSALERHFFVYRNIKKLGKTLRFTLVPQNSPSLKNEIECSVRTP